MVYIFESLRSFAVAGTFFTEATLARAFDAVRFVQADTIGRSARAQDLILRHRVSDW
jgi:uncharacterized protein